VDDFRASAADVDDCHFAAHGQCAQRAGERETSFLGAVDDLHRRAEHRLGRAKKRLRVFGVAKGARADRRHPVNPYPLDLSCIVAQAGERCRDRTG
jgi:hypothetical protein